MPVQYTVRPGEIGGWPAGLSVAWTERVRLKSPCPDLGRNRMSDLGQIRDFSAVRSVANCLQQPQDRNIDPMVFADCEDNRLRILPPGKIDRDGCQPAD